MAIINVTDVYCDFGVAIGFIGVKVLRREDGKILKPDTFSPPNLLPLAVAAMEGVEA